MDEIISKKEEILSFVKRIDASGISFNSDTISEIKDTMDLLEDVIDTFFVETCIEDYKNNALHIIK